MRQIGFLANETLAQRFVDYLVTVDILAQCDEDEAQWVIWVRNEDQLDQAKTELQEFSGDPDNARYLSAGVRALEIRNKAIQKKLEARKNTHSASDHWSSPLVKRAPILLGLIVACVAAAVLGGGFRTTSLVDQLLMFTENPQSPSAFVDIVRGQVWRLVTPVFLHDGFFHLLFNMYWMFYFGSQLEPRMGKLRFIMLFLLTAIIPNVLQASIVGPNFLGISGVVYGLFGYMLARRSDGYLMSEFTIAILLVFLVLDFTPARMHSNIAVWAHGGGFVTGVAIGFFEPFLRWPSKNKT